MLGKRVGGYEGRRVGRWLVRRGLAGLTTFLRQLSGMPRYAEYVRHMRRRHQDQLMLSESEYYDEYLRTRYGDGPTRCC